jgi:hypothetical protein
LSQPIVNHTQSAKGFGIVRSQFDGPVVSLECTMQVIDVIQRVAQVPVGGR